MMTLLMPKEVLTEDEAKLYIGETVLFIESIRKHNLLLSIHPKILKLCSLGSSGLFINFCIFIS